MGPKIFRFGILCKGGSSVKKLRACLPPLSVMRLLVLLGAAILAISFYHVCGQNTQAWKSIRAAGYTPLATSGQSKIYSVQTSGNYQYEWPVYLLDLHGSFYQMGYDYGFLAGQQVKTNYITFFASLLGDTFLDELKLTALEAFLDWQWKFLSIEMPAQFEQELQGLRDGGRAAGIAGVYSLDLLTSRLITISNAPGSFGDLIYIFLDELNHTHTATPKLFETVQARLDKERIRPVTGRPHIKGGFGCSMFAIWGPRTQGGELFSARNLDWASDLGISQHKLVTIYHPPGGASYATFGYAGIIGALAGISQNGITVHEATLEENEMSFYGFPWSLRLRYVLQNAQNLQSALKIWDTTNNTVSFNHMITSASDLPATPAVAMETMKDYNAFFFDNDPREASATVQGVHIGSPLPNAIWRTNHPYDPVTMSHYLWNEGIKSWSVQRYFFGAEAFSSYERNKIAIDIQQAINVTAILADKGTDPYHCHGKTGSNIMSIMFQPGASKVWAAWEDGHGAQWVPGPCAAYVEFDLSIFW